MRRSIPKVAEVVASELRSHILGNGLAPGTRLPSEVDLMERYSASRASVREAIRLLERDGLVTVRPGPGGGNFSDLPDRDLMTTAPAVYLTASKATVSEFLVFRQVVEPEIARLAALNATDEQRAELLQAVAREEDPDANARQGHFHDVLLRATNNRVIEAAAAFLSPTIDLTVVPALASAEDSLSSHRAHQKIAAAVADGDSIRAREAMRVHVDAYEGFMNAFDLADVPVLPAHQWLGVGNPLKQLLADQMEV